MSNGYIKSDKISVFPCANRAGSYNVPSRMMSEYNITNIVNQLVDAKEFVITSAVSPTQKTLEFNIRGYYFNIEDYNDILSIFTKEDLSGGKIYAVITVTNRSSDGINFVELKNNSSEIDTSLDGGKTTDSKFYGIRFQTAPDNSETATTRAYSLLILQKVNGVWEIPTNSTIRYMTNSGFRSVVIDDGEL